MGDSSLEADEAYVSNGYVVPELRGKRLYPLLLGEVCGRLRSRGVPSVLIASSPFHVPSVRAIEGAGFLPIRDGRLQRVGGWRRLRWNGVPGTA